MHSAKVLTAIVILVAIVIGFGFYSINILNSTSERLDGHISEIESSIKSQSWDKAAREMSSFDNTWSSTSKTWAMLLDHVEIDNIDDTFTRLTQFIDVKNQSLALGEAAALKQFVKHIPEKEQLNIKNIF